MPIISGSLALLLYYKKEAFICLFICFFFKGQIIHYLNPDFKPRLKARFQIPISNPGLRYSRNRLSLKEKIEIINYFIIFQTTINSLPFLLIIQLTNNNQHIN